MRDTIFALATAAGRAGVSVVRISGPDARRAVGHICAGSLPSHRAVLRNITNFEGALLDQALVLAFDEGSSFTGEEVVELHLHGSIAIVNAVLSVLGRIDGLRPADAGEFTRRALANDRMDLAQVEGLSDLIDAETELQRQQAQAVFSGAFSADVESWRSRLLRATALMEATIDFADEDVPVDVVPEVSELLTTTIADMQMAADGVKVAERVRDGFQVALVGRPNAGKSTLLNRIAGRDVAITSDIAGTTRDVIEVQCDLGGLPVTFLDTAGLRDTDDVVEGMGVSRTAERAKQADIRLFLLDDQGVPPEVTPQAEDILVRGKADLGQDGPAVSGLTGEGLDDILDQIEDYLKQRVAKAGTATRQRHQLALEAGIEMLNQALSELAVGDDRAEIAAENLRSALRKLDQLVGRIDVEQVLGEIFSSFCIGK